MNVFRIGAVVSVLALAGCSIQQTVKPVKSLDVTQVCIVSNPSVRASFSDKLQSSLSMRGFDVRVLTPSTPVKACPVSLTYTASWRWDLALYMAPAQINVFEQGLPAGEAVYDARSGGGSFGKFINADQKIEELVNQLLPSKQSSQSKGQP